MGGTHNKRGKALAAKQKERKAQSHGARNVGGGGPHHFRHRHGYLSNFVSKKQNAYQSTSTNMDPLDAQLFDYLVVVDVEATCERGNDNFPHEIIEFPGVLIDVRRGIVDKEHSFHTFVRPVNHPKLSHFCTELTGIRQEQVDAAPVLSDAIRLFETWLRKTIPRGAKVVFASDGPWDFKKFFYEHHVLRDQIALPTLFYEYIDIRTSYAHHFNAGVPLKLNAMLRNMELHFVGREHCGFDDAYNIARLATEMMRRGCVLDFLVCIPLDDDNVHYTLQDFPVYRREEGSGRLDRDVVEDIAKGVYGEAYFSFGQEQEKAVWEFRRAHPERFTVHQSVLLRQRAQRARRRWRRRWMWRGTAILLLLFVIMLAYYYYYYYLRCA